MLKIATQPLQVHFDFMVDKLFSFVLKVFCVSEILLLLLNRDLCGGTLRHDHFSETPSMSKPQWSSGTTGSAIFNQETP